VITFIVELSSAVQSATARMARGLTDIRGLLHLHLILWPVDGTYALPRQSGSVADVTRIRAVLGC
jgi:hypothetical protein